MMKRIILSIMSITVALSASAQESQAPPQPAAQDSLQASPAIARPQAAEADSIKKRPGMAKEKSEPKELELEAIAIEAVVEKPNVDIIPKRAKPDFQEVGDLDRSFARELKAVSKELLLGDEDIDQPQKVEGLKKIPAKKKD
jgi:hypothetical protein